MNRPADKAGSWYSGDAESLRNEVNECLRNGIKRYGAALEATEGKPVAVAVPHAGLFFSGALAGLTFELVRRRWDTVDTFVIFGACHRERLREPGIWPDGEWDTPLGSVPVNNELAAEFIKAGIGDANKHAHIGDNSIELQMPFIKVMFPKAKIVPVAMAPFPKAWKYGEQAAEIVKKHGGGNVIAVASTDLTHYGSAFGIVPAGVGDKALVWTRENDQRFLDAVEKMDLENIVAIAERDGSACGAGAVAATAGWAKSFGCTKARVLARTDSHEIMPSADADHIVGYGAIAFPAE